MFSAFSAYVCLQFCVVRIVEIYRDDTAFILLCTLFWAPECWYVLTHYSPRHDFSCRTQLNVRAAANPWSRYDTMLYGYASHRNPDVSTVQFADRDEEIRENEEAIELEGLSPGSTYVSPYDSTRNLL